jgi:hypothetical protein
VGNIGVLAVDSVQKILVANLTFEHKIDEATKLQVCHIRAVPVLHGSLPCSRSLP